MSDSLIKLPSSLSSKGFSLATHVFRYRPDIWRKEENVSRNYSVEEIEKSAIWHATIGSLNDPFEVYAPSNKRELQEMTDDEYFIFWLNAFAKYSHPFDGWLVVSEKSLRTWYNRKIIKADVYEQAMNTADVHFSKFLNKLRTDIAIASFTKVCDSRLMWGYYCNGLKGFCIIYNKKMLSRSKIELEAVDYQTIDHKVNVLDFVFGYKTKRNMDLLTNIPKFKHKEWEHENEIRSLYVLSGEDAGKGSAINIDERCIDGIIIGAGISEETKSKILELSSRRGFSVFRAYANLEDFCIEVRDYS